MIYLSLVSKQIFKQDSINFEIGVNFENEILLWKWDWTLKVRLNFESEILLWMWDFAVKVRFYSENEIVLWKWDFTAKVRFDFLN